VFISQQTAVGGVAEEMVRIPVKKATGEWSDPVTASIAGWLFESI